MSRIKIASICLFVILLFSSTSLHQKSTKPDHCIYFSKRNEFLKTLNEDNIFCNNPVFWFIQKTPPLRNRIQPGEYLIKLNETAVSVLTKVITGQSVTRKITFPEGYTVKMIIEKLYNNKNLVGKIQKIPEEASLFPSTYFYKKGDSRESILCKMHNKMKKIIKKTAASKEDLILASIIEKETNLTFEKPIIASVFKNRLKLKMKLQSDPTVIYAITNQYGYLNRPLSRSDWKFDSPYNTYRYKGLPPTAICCPSYESIIAAIKPSQTNYLYFVLTSDQKHHSFSHDYKTHINNINKNKKN